jgi:hypothetical protein
MVIHGPFAEAAYRFVPMDSSVGTVIKMPMKYKHCCGDIASKKIVARAKQNIANVVRHVLGLKKDSRNIFQRITSFFKRSK